MGSIELRLIFKDGLPHKLEVVHADFDILVSLALLQSAQMAGTIKVDGLDVTFETVPPLHYRVTGLDIETACVRMEREFDREGY